MPLLLIALAAALFMAFRGAVGTGRREAEALQRWAQSHGKRFLSVREGGPAVCFDADGHEGEARFRSGKRRFRLGNHVRVRIALGSPDSVRLRVAPPMLRHGRPVTMLYPPPVSSQGRLREGLFDIHATSDSLLEAALADGTAAFITRRHPGVWLEIKNGRVEVRLAGEADASLVAEAIGVAVGVHARTRRVFANVA